MLPRVVLATTAVALAACGSSAASGPSAMTCGPRSGHTLASGRSARVYAAGTAVYGCAVGATKRVALGTTRPVRPGGQSVMRIAVGGVYAGYAVQQSGVDTASATVVVTRLTDGRRVFAASAIAAPRKPEFVESVQSIVVGRHGSVAWIGAGGSLLTGSTSVELHATQHGRDHVLASSPLIEPKSLTLRGSRLTWSQGGTMRTATLR